MELRVKPQIEYLVEAQIEHIANTLLDRYECQEGVISAPPIPIEFIVEDYLGYEIKWDNFQEDNTLAFIDPNNKVICFNLSRSDYFDRIGPEYTMAHEIGHFQLGHFEEAQKQLLLGLEDQPPLLLHREDKKSPYNRHEIQAEYFASCLLMPRKFIIDETKNYDLLKWNSIYTLAERYNVSVTAMKKRLENLKLIYVKDNKIYNSKQEAYGMKPLL